MLVPFLQVMKLIKKTRNFYVDYSFHVALAVVSLVVVTAYYVGFEIQMAWLVCLGLFTTAVYSFAKHAHTLTRWNRWFWLILLLVSGITSVLYFQPQTSVWWLVVLVGILTTWYLFPFLGKNFRSVPVVKVLVVACIWSVMTVFLPVIRNLGTVETTTVLLGIQRFLLVVVWILPFEIRDLKTDDRHLKTIPQLVGVFYTKLLGWLLLGFILGIEIFLTTDTRMLIIAILIFLLSGILLGKSSTEQSPYFAAFWVEGIPIYWALLLLFNELLEGKSISIF